MATRKTATTTKKTATKKAAAELAAEVNSTVTEAAAVEKAVEEKKTAAAKKTAEKKETAPKAAKKTAAKKAEMTVTATVEFQNKSVLVSDIKAKAIEAFKASHADAEIKTLELYIQPEENVAYYVVNGEGSADFKVEL